MSDEKITVRVCDFLRLALHCPGDELVSMINEKLQDALKLQKQIDDVSAPRYYPHDAETELQKQKDFIMLLVNLIN